MTSSSPDTIIPSNSSRIGKAASSSATTSAGMLVSAIARHARGRQLVEQLRHAVDVAVDHVEVALAPCADGPGVVRVLRPRGSESSRSWLGRDRAGRATRACRSRGGSSRPRRDRRRPCGTDDAGSSRAPRPPRSNTTAVTGSCAIRSIDSLSAWHRTRCRRGRRRTRGRRPTECRLGHEDLATGRLDRGHDVLPRFGTPRSCIRSRSARHARHQLAPSLDARR